MFSSCRLDPLLGRLSFVIAGLDFVFSFSLCFKQLSHSSGPSSSVINFGHASHALHINSRNFAISTLVEFFSSGILTVKILSARLIIYASPSGLLRRSSSRAVLLQLLNNSSSNSLASSL